MTTAHAQALKSLRKIHCADVRVLVVEDNDASARLAIELLRAAGFANISAVKSAEAATRHLQSHNPDLLLCDWNLPGMSGLDLVRAIRQSALDTPAPYPNPQVPIVMLTARQKARDVTAARNAGVNEFVVKPFSTTSLLRAVARALTRKHRFIVSAAFVGPDRRRRKASLFPGLLKRSDDVTAVVTEKRGEMFRQQLAAEMSGLRAYATARGGLTPRTLDHLAARLLDAERKAHDFRLDLIARVTRSLNEYVRCCAPAVDSDVLDLHLDTLIRLNDVPTNDRDYAVSLVEHLDRLVAKRQDAHRRGIKAAS